jgi:hypothetical protein
MDILAPYTPLVVGTIPLGIDTAASDIDIVCEVRDTRSFAELMAARFGGYENFEVRLIGSDRIVCRFSFDGEQIEVYGSPTPSARSEGWRHMMVEARLLAMFGEDFRDGIVALKERGVKTEPAFARMLGLDGDPYRAMLDLE